MASYYTWGPETTLHDYESVLGWPLHTFLGLSQFHGHGSWLVCKVALRFEWHQLLCFHCICLMKCLILEPPHKSNAQISVLFLERNWRVHFNELRTFVPFLMPWAMQKHEWDDVIMTSFVPFMFDVINAKIASIYVMYI